MPQTLVFRYALNPTKNQEQALASHVGAVRYAYNWALNYVQTNWEAVKKDPTIPYVNVSAYSLRKALNEQKDTIAPWWGENSKEAFNTGVTNAAQALQNWFKKRAGFPKYKKRHHDTQTGVTFTTGVMRLEPTKHFTVPRIGKIRLYENPLKLRWLLKRGARITQVSIKKTRNPLVHKHNNQNSRQPSTRILQHPKKHHPKKNHHWARHGIKKLHHRI